MSPVRNDPDVDDDDMYRKSVYDGNKSLLVIHILNSQPVFVIFALDRQSLK